MSVLGNLVLVIATIAVFALVGYLVTNPPGRLSNADAADLPALPTSSAAATSGAVAPTSAAAPTAADLVTACASLTPLLDRSDAVIAQVVAAEALDAGEITGLANDLTGISGVSPAELTAQIDPLVQILVNLNSAVLAGDTSPDVDTDVALADTAAMRETCTP